MKEDQGGKENLTSGKKDKNYRGILTKNFASSINIEFYIQRNYPPKEKKKIDVLRQEKLREFIPNRPSLKKKKMLKDVYLAKEK